MFFSRQRDNAMNALSSFTSFYKRNSNGQEPGSRFRRQALEDLGAFTTFMKKADPKAEAANTEGYRYGSERTHLHHTKV